MKRIEEFYEQNPDKVRKDLIKQNPVNGTPSSAPALGAVTEEEVENYSGSQRSSVQLFTAPTAPSGEGDDGKAEKVAEASLKKEFTDAIANKKAEQKALDSLEIKFHDRLHFVDLKATLDLEHVGENLAIVRLGEIDIFFNDLADRKVLIKRDYDLGLPRIKRQICKVSLDGRVPMVELLIDSRELKVQPQDKFFKLQIERTEKDGPDQFFLPQHDVFDDVSSSLFDLSCPVVATTTADVVLPPKAFHTETCDVSLGPEDMEVAGTRKVILERTADHGMNIGMRKMILVPKIVSEVKVEGGTAKVEVRIYNASRQRLRISKKTNIAKVYLCKNKVLDKKVGIIIIN